MAIYKIDQIKQKIDSLHTMRMLEPEEFCDENGLADSLVQALKKEGLKPTQLRKVFHELKRIQKDVETEIRGDVSRLNENFDRKRLMKLLPLLAYAKGRKLIHDHFYQIMKTCLSAEKLKNNEDFLKVVEFVEAILAYHKFRHPSS
jgi:CRISPR-associated protein Csm2